MASKKNRPNQLENEKLISSMTKFKESTTAQSELDKNKVQTTIPFEKHFQWIYNSYSSMIPKLLTPTDWSKGMLKRVSNVSTMKYGVLPSMLRGNVVVFKLFDYNLRKEINYATIFCENIVEIPEKMRKNVNPVQIIGNVVIQYYSVSSSFISCDGEYRARFNKFSDLIEAKINYPEIWNEIDSYVSSIRVKRNWSIYPTYFHDNDKNMELERVIKSDLIAASLLNLAWFHVVYAEYMSMTESHMNATFADIMFRNMSTDVDFMKELVKKYSDETVEKFKVVTSHIVHPIFGSKNVRYVPLGYKMIPLNTKELQDPLKLKYKPWREFLIGNKCNDFVINQIAPGFPILLDWFLIKKSNKGLFDNKSQYERLKHSELAKGILELLNEAQRSTYFATSDLGKANKSSEHIKQWISTKFKRLSDRISDPIDYAIEEIIMSDVTLVMPSEFVGRTIADSVNLIKENKVYDAAIGKPFSDYDVFAKYLFEICYNLLALNKRLGAIHGDFHLNNATIGHLYQVDEPGCKVVYILDEKYIFPNFGYFGCLIDFSRSIINPESFENFTDFSLPENFKLVNDYDKFALNESHNLLNLYLQLFPGKQKQREELTVLFKNKYPAVFKLLTCIDIYMFSLRLGTLLRQQPYTVNKRCFDLIDKINRLAEGFIATDMNHLMSDDKYYDTVLANPWPLETIIKKCFSEYINGSIYKKLGTIIDCYVLDGKLDKSINMYDKFPDALKYAKYEVDGKTVDIPFINDWRRSTRETYENSKLHNLEHVKFLAR